MTKSGPYQTSELGPLRLVIILADESANWKIAGLRQLDRLLLSVAEFARTNQPGARIDVRIIWDERVDARSRCEPANAVLANIETAHSIHDVSIPDGEASVVLSTRLVPSRVRFAEVIAALANDPLDLRNTAVEETERQLNARLRTAVDGGWDYLASRDEIAAAEQRFLKQNGKSQDGLASRFVNRPLSRLVTRWLLKSSITPSTWSVLIFALPLCAAGAFLSGTYSSFLLGCVIFQLYSILDGCDGEIARARFLESEFGRRLDSFCDLLGNLLLALTLGIGLARHAEAGGAPNSWLYLAEGIAAAGLIVLSEGIVFVRRTRPDGAQQQQPTRWNGALYQRHHEFLERSGILLLGERFAWWLVQLTKRDMAMLAFVLLALVGWPQCILHLLLAVSGVSSALAGNAFLRPAAPAIAQEAT